MHPPGTDCQFGLESCSQVTIMVKESSVATWTFCWSVVVDFVVQITWSSPLGAPTVEIAYARPWMVNLSFSIEIATLWLSQHGEHCEQLSPIQSSCQRDHTTGLPGKDIC